MPANRFPVVLLLATLALVACSPEPTPAEPTPIPEKEPTPQAMAGNATELRDAIQAPQDKARAVEDTLMQAADAQREAIDAAESGETTAPEDR
ncbi:hypothetical protein GCM10028794_07770 [Silanimonas algicola]